MTVKLWDYHTHNLRCCHAEGTIEEYVKAAIACGLSEIGISDHFPMYLLPKEADVWKYAMKTEEFPQYIAEAERLRGQYQQKIKVKIASEVDFYPAAFEAYKKAVTPYLDNFDYLLGSVHVIGPWEGSPAFGVDDDIGMAKCRQFGADRVYIEYYDLLLKMVKTGFYNIVGHLDLPKKFGIRPEHPEIVDNKLSKLLDAIIPSGMSVEINLAGLLKPVKEQYPSDNIIKEIIQRNIPINFGSDSHRPAHVGYEFGEMLPKLKQMGLTRLCQWTKRLPTFIKI